MTNRIRKFEQMIEDAAGTDAEMTFTDGEIVFWAMTDDRNWLQVRLDNDHTFETFTVSTGVDGWMDMLDGWLCSTIQLLDPPQVPDLPTGEFSEDMDDHCPCDATTDGCPECNPMMERGLDEHGVLRLSRNMIEVPLNSDEDDEELPF